MKESSAKKFENLLHPYAFILKEGAGIQNDLLDYSLLLLQVSQYDILPSPYSSLKVSTPFIQLLNK